MNAPRWRGGTKKIQQARLTAETKRQLRALSAALDESCPTLVRSAIANLIVKYSTGGERCPVQLPLNSTGTGLNQQTLIDATTREQLIGFAHEQRCFVADLMREAIDDLLRHHQKQGGQP
jgi:hypothetical protein